MANIKLYGIIFVVLGMISTTQFLVESFLPDGLYWVGLVAILALSTGKAIAVAGYYMHLVEEPRSITYLALSGVLCVVALTAGAGYSVV
ncbi:cytochrome C oxidase subunit IV family protein [Halovenus halobia]|uniref:cytochrome C oxidase subunit IV family protein n=1 Tax=Halovenus halobia TaxID=3396622 RepID=UPI003F57EDC9